jgi:hypothetical protein
MNRRCFLLCTAASIATPPAEFGQAFAPGEGSRLFGSGWDLANAQPPPQSSSNSGAWYTTMRRCGQINYNERDPHAEAWADYWAS